jgi:hypothetical protein
MKAKLGRGPQKFTHHRDKGKEEYLISKPIAYLLLLFLVPAVFLPGCKDPGNKEYFAEYPEELLGSFAGPAGTLYFYPDEKVLVNLSDEYLYLLEGKENNQIYGYVFIRGNEKTFYYESEAFYLHDGKDTFAMINSTADKDKIIFILGNGEKALFERRSDQR